MEISGIKSEINNKGIARTKCATINKSGADGVGLPALNGVVYSINGRPLAIARAIRVAGGDGKTYLTTNKNKYWAKNPTEFAALTGLFTYQYPIETVSQSVLDSYTTVTAPGNN